MGLWGGSGRGKSSQPWPRLRPQGCLQEEGTRLGGCRSVPGARDRERTRGASAPARSGEGGSGSAVPAPPAPGNAEDSGRLGKRRLSNSCPVPQHFPVT